MDAQRTLALMLVSLIALAGCLGAAEPEPVDTTPETTTYTVTLAWVNAPLSTVVGDQVVVSYAVAQDGEGDFILTPRLVLPSFEDGDLLWDSDTNTLRFTPTTTGDHIVTLRLSNNGDTILEGDDVELIHVVDVQEPLEAAPVLSMPNRLVLDGPNIVWFEGAVEHTYPTSCTVVYTVTNGNSGNIALNAEHGWRVLMDFTESSDLETISVTATCGEYTSLSDSATTTVLIEGASDDTDGDVLWMQRTDVPKALAPTKVGPPPKPPMAMGMGAAMSMRTMTTTTTASTMCTTVVLNPSGGRARPVPITMWTVAVMPTSIRTMMAMA